jgi:WD40 repeat protein
LAFSPAVEGRSPVLVTASQHEMLLWDLATGEVRRKIADISAPVFGMAFLGDGVTLATAQADGLRFWDVERGSCKTRRDHTGAVFCVAIATDGKGLASAGADGRILLWEGPDDAKPDLLVEHTGQITALAFSPSNPWLVATDGSAAKLYDLEIREKHKEPTLVFRGHTRSITWLGFTRDGQRLATASGLDRHVKIWDPVSGLATLTLSHGSLHQIAGAGFHPDGRRLAVAIGRDIIIHGAAEEE